MIVYFFTFFIINFHIINIYIFAVQNVNVGLFSERFIIEGKARCMNRYCYRNFEDVTIEILLNLTESQTKI